MKAADFQPGNRLAVARSILREFVARAEAYGIDYNIIEAFDQHGKRVTTGGDKFAVNVDGPQPLGSVPVKDNGDGTHSSGYKVDKPGRYNVAVTVRDEPVKGSPFSVLVENGNTAIIAGLIPILWSTGTGSEVMSRIAAPMVGGMISSTVLTLAVIPAIYAWVNQWRIERRRVASLSD